MVKRMNWYVLFVITGMEHKAVDEISRFWRIDGVRPFVPMHEACFKKDVFQKRRLFPGYIFVEAALGETEFSINTYSRIAQSRFLIRLLRYGGRDNYSFVMNEKEREIFTKLYNDEHCVEMSQGFFEGDRVVITDGPLIGFESCIKRINRHKMEATLELELMGSIRLVTVGLQIVEKVMSSGALFY